MVINATTFRKPIPVNNPDDPRSPSFLAHMRSQLLACVAGLESSADALRLEREQLKASQRALDDLAAGIRFDVAADRGLTNSEQRKAAVDKRLRAHPDARRIQAEIDGHESRLAELEVDHDTWRRSRQNALAVMEFSAAWLRFQVRDRDEERFTR